MAKIPDPRLRAYVVWVPKRGGQEKDVRTATQYLSDPRATHYWDGQRVLVESYDRALALGQDAWDIYFLYGPEARWEGDLPPKPDFWMHQLHHLPESQFLDAAVLAERTKAALAGTGARDQ